MQHSDSDFHEDREVVFTGGNKKLDWMMSRNYTFILYQTLSDYQKALVRRTLEAKRMYRRTGTSLQLHEQSVRTIRRMMGETKEMGVYRKTGGQQIRQSLKQKELEQQKVQKEVRRILCSILAWDMDCQKIQFVLILVCKKIPCWKNICVCFAGFLA